MAFAHAHVKVNSTFLYYDERGNSFQHLVLLHGFPMDRRIWAAQVQDLSSIATVITPDLRGFGQSRSTEPFSIESQADDLHALLTQLDVLPCVLGGLSMGGYVALAFAAKYATDLKGLALVDTRADADSPATREGRAKMIELAKEKGSAAVADAMLPKLLAADADPRVAAELRKILLDCPALTIQHAQAAMRDRPDRTEILAKLNIPCRIIVGELDVLSPPAVAHEMSRRIRRCDLTIIPGAGHVTPMENAGAVSAALSELIV